MRTTVLYLALMVGVAAGLTLVGKFWTFAKLTSHGVQTSAVVKHQTCSQHLSLRYEFSANGRPYEGVATSEDCQRLAPGSALVVFYLPSEPAINTIGDPASQLRNEGFTIGLVALVLPALLLWLYARRKRAHGA